MTAHAKGDMRELTAKAKDAGIFEVEYRDGLRAFVVMPNGWIHESDGASFFFAGQRKGQDKPDVCQFYLQQPDPFAHFAELTKAIDSLVQHRPRAVPGRAHAAHDRHPRRGDDQPAREGQADRDAAPGDQVQADRVGRRERGDSEGLEEVN